MKWKFGLTLHRKMVMTIQSLRLLSSCSRLMHYLIQKNGREEWDLDEVKRNRRGEISLKENVLRGIRDTWLSWQLFPS
ncbi:hypothetical protein VNO77_39357 [Canavalia gladiata]|uniref:Uncharacterized protein n=1 Tax=Canavalia gladiata TaxID=3824 RepID=A0AAN9KAX8_CANGL